MLTNLWTRLEQTQLPRIWGAVLALALVLGLGALDATTPLAIDPTKYGALLGMTILYSLAVALESWGRTDYALALGRLIDSRKFRALFQGTVALLLLWVLEVVARAIGVNLDSLFATLGSVLGREFTIDTVATAVAGLVSVYIFGVGSVDTIKGLRTPVVFLDMVGDAPDHAEADAARATPVSPVPVAQPRPRRHRPE